MLFRTAAIVATIAAISPLAATAASAGVEKNLRGGEANHHKRLLLEEDYTFLVADIQYEDGVAAAYRKLQGNSDFGRGGGNNPNQPEHTLNVEDANGEIYEIEVGSGDTSGISSGATVTLPPQAFRNPSGKINLGGGALVQKKNRDLQEDGSATDLRRHLADNIGTKTVVAVRVVAGGGAYNHATEAGLSDDVFGTGSDSFNLKKAYEGCSHGQLQINPGGAANGIVDGVVTITVGTAATSGNDSAMRNAVTDAIKAQFGVSHPTVIADHWMYCLPPGVMNGIAYAFINSWMSVYSNQWCNYPSGQVHELGHNFGYAHSNEGTSAYADQSGMMGYSYSQDEGPVMCFNAAKSWQTGWFNNKRVNMNIGGSGATDNCLETDITGQADYNDGLSQTILVKMNRSSGRDLFLMYNKKTGVNSGTVEGGNTVMIVEADGEGTAYGESSLLAKLGSGGSKTFTNYLGDGRDLVVTVPSTNDGKAQIKIDFGGLCATNPPTPNPTAAPPPPGTYLLACGSSAHWNGDCNGQTLAADTAERHEVRCCKDSVTKPEGNWYQYSGRGAICANVWGESEDSNGVCQDALHYGEALAMCADLGGRLCTSAELLADCTRGSGCQHDRDMIWSSTEVVPTSSPTSVPTANPTTANPTPAPTPAAPSTAKPTANPTPVITTANPTVQPTNAPSTAKPTTNPTPLPTALPTANPTSHPTTAQPTSAPTLSYYAVGGSSTNAYAGVAKESDPSELHKVRCCVDASQRGGVTDLGTSGTGWNQHANCQAAGFDTWGESDPAGVCNPSKTYTEAVEICSAVGARLCTKEELLNDCPRGTGCNFDKELNWSSTPVPVISCSSDASCDDGKLCTTNTCGVDGRCEATTPIPGCTKSVVCGSTAASACKNDPVREADPNDLHEVRCCSDTSLGSGWRQHDNCLLAGFSTWGESEISGVCHRAQTYEEAVDICWSVGARLCSKEELLADCPRGTGCNFDREYNWSSSPYTAPAGDGEQPLANGGADFVTTTSATVGFDVVTTTEVPPVSTCNGDGICQPNNGENCMTCPGDCAGRSMGNPSKRFCCGDTVTCADARCTKSGWQCAS